MDQWFCARSLERRNCQSVHRYVGKAVDRWSGRSLDLGPVDLWIGRLVDRWIGRTMDQ